MKEFLFEKCWKDAKKEIQDNNKYEDLFFDWFCRDSALHNKAKNIMGKIDFVFKKLSLDETQYKVSLKNNCPFYGTLYDTFIIDAIDESKRIWISPKLGYSNKELNSKCELVVIKYEKQGVETKLDIKFNNWQTFKNNINNGNLVDQITEALK